MKIDYTWYSDTHTAVCAITEKGQEWLGIAYCHPDDLDFGNERTGLIIAEYRARIDYNKEKRRNLRQQYTALERLYRQVINGANYSPKSRENRILWSELRRLKNELTAVNYDLSQLRKNLKTFIDEKEEFYNKIRSKRKDEEVTPID